MSSTKITGLDIDDEYKLKQIQVTLPSTGWSDTAPYIQAITIQGVTATNIVICSSKPAQANFEMIGECKVMCTEQSVNRLTFTAFEGKPSINLTFNLLVGGE